MGSDVGNRHASLPKLCQSETYQQLNIQDNGFSSNYLPICQHWHYQTQVLFLSLVMSRKNFVFMGSFEYYCFIQLIQSKKSWHKDLSVPRSSHI